MQSIVLLPTPDSEPPKPPPFDWKGALVAFFFVLFSIATLFCFGFALVIDDGADRATACVLFGALTPVIIGLGRGLVNAGKQERESK